ncbi:MAG: ParM/StbA family protein [Chromatiaceae bacterium]|nr:MAG: ParM/StbA family protein [Chromatiaceae bacterium]
MVGLDIGYSNLKLAFGPRGAAPQVIVRPAGAAPAHLLAASINGAPPEQHPPIEILVDDTRWIAGVEQGRLEAGWQRTLHEDYSTTQAYAALARAALILTGARRIDVLVTGLPAVQAADQARVSALQRLLTGRHFNKQSGDIQVGEVRVIAQPIGAYLDVIASVPDDEIIDRIAYGAALIIDAGYYSLDWSVIVEGQVHQRAGGSSLEAMSVILNRAAALAAEVAGGRAQPATLEQALRTGRTYLYQCGSKLMIEDLLEVAARETTPVALEALRQALRREVRNIDLVILAGGGCRFYQAAAEALFPAAQVVIPQDAVATNARGFFAHAGA